MAMSPENKKKASERMKKMLAEKKAAKDAALGNQDAPVEPEESVESLKARIAELEEKKSDAPKEKDIDAKIKQHYMLGQGSIQDLARIYGKTVDEVLVLLNLNDMIEVPTRGDMIDQDEAGKEVTVNPMGKPAKANYTTN